jgi:putative hydrolase of the HAD superfamily
MARIKAVFFDAAGTLFETSQPVGETYANIARADGVDTSAEALNAAFRRTFREAIPLAFGPGRKAGELRSLEREWWRGLVAKTFANFGQFRDFDGYFDTLFEFFADPTHWTADPHASSTLRSLRQLGLTLGVISNFDFRLYRILGGLGLARWFDSITISSEAGYAKPSTMVFETALRRHQLTAAEALHVGDSEHLDVAGAAAAGLTAVLIDRETNQPISARGQATCISSLPATIDLLNSLQ